MDLFFPWWSGLEVALELIWACFIRIKRNEIQLICTMKIFIKKARCQEGEIFAKTVIQGLPFPWQRCVSSLFDSIDWISFVNPSDYGSITLVPLVKFLSSIENNLPKKLEYKPLNWIWDLFGHCWKSEYLHWSREIIIASNFLGCDHGSNVMFSFFKGMMSFEFSLDRYL